MLFCGVPRYFEASFNLSALLSSFCLCQASCSSPLVNPLQAVSPSYSTTFPAFPHVSHLTRYPTPLFSQFPPPVLQGKQFSLPHPVFLSGSGLARCLTAWPALSTTEILIPVTFSKFAHTSFASFVRLPPVGSRIKGADACFGSF